MFIGLRNNKLFDGALGARDFVRGLGARAVSLAMTSLLFAVVFSSASFAIFENDVIYPVGANAFTLGGSSTPSSLDTLGFLRNPAAAVEIGSKNYVFSRGSFSTELSGNYSFFLFSMTQRGKSAITFSKSSSPATSQRRLTYSYGSRDSKQRLAYGLNVSTFQFRKNVTSFSGVTTRSDANGFLFDVGFLYQLNAKTRVGFAIINFIPSVGSEKDTSVSGNQNFVPRNMNIGLRYALRDNVNMNLSLQRFSYNNTDMRSYNNMTLGFEYAIPGKTSAGFSTNKLANSQGDGETDKFFTAGAGYRTKSFDVAVAGSLKNDLLGGGNIMTVTYKPGGEWEGQPLKAPDKVAIATATAHIPATKTVFTQPLPVLKDPVVPATTVDATQFPVDRDGMLEPVSAPPLKKTRPIEVEDVSVDPAVIIVPFGDAPEFTGLDGHWAEKFALSLSDRGFFPGASGAFRPDELAGRREFYRLLLLLQLSRSYSRPVTALFSTDEPVRAAATFAAPHLSTPIQLLKGRYEKAGSKRIFIGRDLLREKRVAAGRYKLHVHLTADDEGEGDFDSPVTVLDTSIDLPGADEQPGAERDKKLANIKDRLEALGLNPDYIKAISGSGPVTRIEALNSLLSALGVSIPSGHENDSKFNDAGPLNSEEKNSLYLGSLPLPSLDYKPLMGGYPDGSFRPGKPITNGESAALIERAGRIDARDLKTSSAQKVSSVTSAPFIDNTSIPAVRERAQTASLSRARAGYGSPANGAASPGNSVIRVIKGGRESVWSAVSSEQPAERPVKTIGRRSVMNEAQAAPVYSAEPPLQRDADNARYLVVAKKAPQLQGAKSAIYELERLGFQATTFVEKTGDDMNYFVILAAYRYEGEAKDHAATPVPNFTLSVKRVELDAAGLKSLPLSARKPVVNKNYNEREVIMNLPQDEAPSANYAPGSYLIQQ